MRRALLFCVAIAFAIACGDSITEPLPDRTQAAPPIAFATTTTEDGLSISTDKDDYQPGDTVQFTGYGWQAGDTLDIVLTDDPQTHEPHTWTVEVGPDGMFHDSTYVVDEGDLNVAFTLVATSRATGRSLTVNFTDSQPTQVTLTPTPQTVTPGGSANYTVNVTMGGNNTTCTVTLSVTGLIPGVTGAFSGGANPFTTNANFSRTLTLSTTAAVTASTVNFTVQASRAANCQGNGTTDGNGVLNVLGPASQLAFVQQPTTRVSTQAFSPAITVQVLDAANHLISSSASITLAIGNNPGLGTLSGTLSQNAVNGVATFPGLSIDKAGTGYTLAASSAGLSGATSSAFDITVGPVNKLAFTTQPSGGATSTAFTTQPVVTVQDAGGNTITSGTGMNANIALSIVTGTGTTGAALTCTGSNSKSASNGVAIFSGCQINLAGTGYRLRAATTINPGAINLSVNSDLFNIVSNNQAPVLAAIGDKTIAEEAQLAFTATATDENVASLQFSLANPATGTFPTGAAITAAGAFTWTPSEAQGPGTYRVKVVVTDNATLTDEEEIQITVTEVNQAPTVTAIPDKTVDEEVALTFTASATDADVPANTLTFSLQAGTDPVPSGASINSSTGAFTWTPTEAQGPGVYEFKVRATDNGTPSLFGEANVKITVNEVNKAPVLAAIGDKSVNEGSELTFTAEASDPDLPANTLTFSLEGAPAAATINASTGVFSWTPADDDPTGTPSDDNTFKVVVKDNGSSQMSDEETITVTVKNVAPVVKVGPDKTGNEGEAVALSGEFTDPGADSHTWAWEYVEGFNAGATCTITNPTTSLTPTITCTDDGVVKVTLTVQDDDTGVGKDDLLLTLSNVAPSATGLNAPAVDEGSNIVLNLTGPTDPSSVDATSLHYAFDCGAGDGFSAANYAGASTTNSASCPTNDNGTRTVKGKVFDKDGGVSGEYSANVTINNVAPTATFNAPSPVNEGSNIALSLTDANDVSSVDKAAGFTYAFDCGDGSGYGAFGSTSSKSCPTTDNGSRTVKGKIRDKDDGVSEYTGTVVINNVAPTITSWTPLADPVIIGATVNFSAAFTDPGTGDTHTGQYDCGSGTYSVAAATTSPFGYSCTFSSIGQKTIRVKITDDDGGFDEKSYTFTVVYNFSGFFAPVDRPNTMNVSKVGQAIPLKWRLTDAGGHAITDLTSVTVQATDFSCGLAGTNDNVEEYAAGASGLQNLGDGYYQFNWKTPANYLNSCKKIGLVFGAGGLGYTEKPGAYFTFKK